MSIVDQSGYTKDERKAYLENEYFEGHIIWDYTPFYVIISICALFGAFLLILNFAFCWCSQHKAYWQDPHTGNRWIQSLWVTTPHNNPPLDLSELEEGAWKYKNERQVVQYQVPQPYPSEPSTHHQQEYLELHKRESEI